MKKYIDKLTGSLPASPSGLLPPTLALKKVLSKGGRHVFASCDLLFKDAIFGRDSLEVAEDLLHLKPKLASNVLYNMAELQGLDYNPLSDEEPGKIVHEYRSIMVDGRLIDRTSYNIFHELSRKWGGSDRELAYYGSVDATPLFLRVLGKYCSVYGQDILSQSVTRRDKKKATIIQTAEQGLDWLLAQLAASRSGLLEFKTANRHGILNQAWKDSNEFYVHENRKPANHQQPIASVEVQGLAYDALLAAAELLPSRTEECKRIARRLRDTIFDRLWLHDKHYFALGLDYTANQSPRLITTLTANPAELLDTQLFDLLDIKQRQYYVSHIVKRILGKDFLSAAGIRSRALSAADLVDFWDYHGSYVSWPKETYDIAKGLKRQGFPQLSRQLENRLLNIIFKTGAYPEFVYVDGWGRVLLREEPTRTHGELVIIEGHNQPEKIQAWTVSAIAAIIAERFPSKINPRKPPTTDAWCTKLEQQLLQQIPRVDRYLNPLKLLRHYPQHRYKLAHRK